MRTLCTLLTLALAYCQPPWASPAINRIIGTAHSRPPFVTDKVTPNHNYEVMYGMFLMPYEKMPNVKMLEIGLGCGMGYGPGASAKLWRDLLPTAELWMADANEACVEQHRSSMPNTPHPAHDRTPDPCRLQHAARISHHFPSCSMANNMPTKPDRFLSGMRAKSEMKATRRYDSKSSKCQSRML